MQSQPTISRKLTAMNMLVSGIALLIAGAAFAGHDLATFRQNVLRDAVPL